MPEASGMAFRMMLLIPGPVQTRPETRSTPPRIKVVAVPATAIIVAIEIPADKRAAVLKVGIRKRLDVTPVVDKSIVVADA